MRKPWFWILMIESLMLVACNSGDPSDYGDEGQTEKVVQGLGTCNRPTGDAGDQTAPFGEYVTGIHRGASSWLLDVETTDLSGNKNVGTINFGQSQASITGAGYQNDHLGSPPDTNRYGRVDHICTLDGSDPVCAANGGSSGRECWEIYEHGTGNKGYIVWHKGAAAPQFTGGCTYFGDGLTKIRGYGRWDAQSIKFYFNNNGAVGSALQHFQGTLLDACTDPY